ncbi:histidine phosphatase family protein [Calidifontibacillus erzurumensis]|uniref:Histidine phosphatase family protein n=1 Tax=Calidifontibacillus erzurumensis TaxID=2741433 RepID=A0A8J8KDA8_9BACI|nr:histidine phosphatase family protein [Calidifontibacillus erzurumensis]NSL50485.1 histidine phosphatase family protein [Calidifontibacillus erzurumensis]
MARSLAITLLRHGLTAENVEKKYVGWSDVPLCEQGIKELEMYKQQGYPVGDVYFVSDLKRCKQTFDLLYGDKNVKPILAPNLRELHFGNWELKTFEDLKNDQQYLHWLDHFETEQIPGGERFCNFKKRVLAGWTQAVNTFFHSNINHIVIISHGGPIRLLLERYAPVQKNFWSWSIKHCQGYTMTTTLERIRRNERCILLQEVRFKEREDGYLMSTD